VISRFSRPTATKWCRCCFARSANQFTAPVAATHTIAPPIPQTACSVIPVTAGHGFCPKTASREYQAQVFLGGGCFMCTRRQGFL
jgi:hypothetical protein